MSSGATQKHDEVLRDFAGSVAAVILFDQSEGEIESGGDPAEV
ncbi:MAG: hypothetical protein WDO18_21355 [Acidobacteriota bacterium]